MDQEEEPDRTTLHASHQLSDTEAAMVRSLEWVLADPALRLEALRQCNAILRKLLGKRADGTLSLSTSNKPWPCVQGKGKMRVIEDVLARVATATEHHPIPTPQSVEEANVINEFHDMRYDLAANCVLCRLTLCCDTGTIAMLYWPFTTGRAWPSKSQSATAMATLRPCTSTRCCLPATVTTLA